MTADNELDVSGLTCPMPLLKAKQALNKLAEGEVLKVIATDPGTLRDFSTFMTLSCHQMLESREVDGVYFYMIKKGSVK
jgi:tRNA 2-thiouridine synthesizing protein A